MFAVFICTVQLQAMPLFDQNTDPMYVINHGAFNQGSGSFTRSDTDSIQGVVANFSSSSLINTGDYVEATFTWTGGGGNNSGNQVYWGFFTGPSVNADGQIAATSDWEGYFQTIATRNSNGSVNSAALAQGEGTQPLFNAPGGAGSGADVNGARVGTGGHRPPLNQSNPMLATLRLERLNATQIRLTSIYVTPREDGGSAGSGSGISWTQDALGNIATFTSTYEASAWVNEVNGIALAGAANFTLSDLQVVMIPEPGTLALILLSATLLVLRRRKA